MPSKQRFQEFSISHIHVSNHEANATLQRINFTVDMHLVFLLYNIVV